MTTHFPLLTMLFVFLRLAVGTSLSVPLQPPLSSAVHTGMTQSLAVVTPCTSQFGCTPRAPPEMGLTGGQGWVVKHLQLSSLPPSELLEGGKGGGEGRHTKERNYGDLCTVTTETMLPWKPCYHGNHVFAGIKLLVGYGFHGNMI